MTAVRISVVLPRDAPGQLAKLVSVEIWDASLADAPSVLLAKQILHDVVLTSNGSMEAILEVPQASAHQVLIGRAHISIDGSGEVKSGDFLTTSYVEVPHNLGSNKLTLPVSQIT